MLEAILLFVGVTIISFLAYKYGKRAGISSKAVDCADYVKWLQENHAEIISHKDNTAKQTGELLFLLTEFMHDPRVFEVFSHEDINELFIRARMVTRYNGRSTIEDVTKFIERLHQNELSKLYPGFYASLNAAMPQ